jgi:hypothetical protein
MAEQRSDDAKLARDRIAQLQNPQWALEQAQIEADAHDDISVGGGQQNISVFGKQKNKRQKDSN